VNAATQSMLSNGPKWFATKRVSARCRVCLDQAAALVLLVLLSPLLLLIAILVWYFDGAPIVFKHYRVGLHGRLFPCLKFRSMRRDATQRLADLLRDDEAARIEWQRDHKLTDDPRITAIGRFLRRTSLDELPQLFNVLRGEMALVGPRPITVAELAKYGGARWHYFSVPPGLTGLWQVSGRSTMTYPERVALDCNYVERRSLLLDTVILLKTVKVVVMREGAT
jgi:exopolysaccharide production protein ExoY